MPTESDLGDLMRRADSAAGAGIDLDRVLRASRARRRPRVVGSAAIGLLALTGAIVPAVVIFLPTASPGMLVVEESSGGSVESGGSVPESLPTAATLTSCGAPAPSTGAGAATTGLVLEAAPVTADAGAPSIPIEVTLRNVGNRRVVGSTTAAPVVTLAAAGKVVWHTPGEGPAGSIEVDLDPGETLGYHAVFEPRICTTDDEIYGLRKTLPDAPAGRYQVSAAIDFVPDGAAADASVLITGPAARVELN